MLLLKQLESEGLGQLKTQYRLRDWGVSRQRYWGAPIPMLYEQHSKEITPVKEHDLPVMLPEDVVINGINSPLKGKYKLEQS